jgi:hypothetical protein
MGDRAHHQLADRAAPSDSDDAGELTHADDELERPARSAIVPATGRITVQVLSVDQPSTAASLGNRGTYAAQASGLDRAVSPSPAGDQGS